MRQACEIEPSDDGTTARAKCVAAVAGALEIQTIAERVETRQVLDKLAHLGVAYAQGYFIARPTSVRTFRGSDQAIPLKINGKPLKSTGNLALIR